MLPLTLPAIDLIDAPVQPRDAWRDAAVVAAFLAPAEPGKRGGPPRLAGEGAALGALYDIDLEAEAERARGTAGTAGWTSTVRLPRTLPDAWEPVWVDLPETIVLVGLGDGSPAALRRAGLAFGRAVAGLGAVTLAAGEELDADGLRAFAEGYLLSAFRMPRMGQRSAEADRETPGALRLLGRTDGAEEALAAARAGARATWLTRLLAATPSNVKDHAWMAERAQELAADTAARRGRLSVEVYDEEWLAKRGMGGILAVGGGSARPPRLVVVTWRPRRRTRHVALVGKGITFDTGGLSLKGSEAMVPMKTDMAGSATVLAAALAAAERGLPIQVTAVLPLAENAVSGSSYRPGDVVRTFDGTTVEISNTDAEGRMVLADALGWAVRTLAPDDVVDVATLTGAATVGLGRHHAALYATAEDLAVQLRAAGELSGEAVWRMPLVEEYRSALDSAVADVAHAPTTDVGGGSITAALFLQRFVGEARWAHLDIAGVGRAGKGEGELPAKAPTGFGARLLLRWLEDLA